MAAICFHSYWKSCQDSYQGHFPCMRFKFKLHISLHYFIQLPINAKQEAEKKPVSESGFRRMSCFSLHCKGIGVKKIFPNSNEKKNIPNLCWIKTASFCLWVQNYTTLLQADIFQFHHFFVFLFHSLHLRKIFSLPSLPAFSSHAQFSGSAWRSLPLYIQHTNTVEVDQMWAQWNLLYCAVVMKRRGPLQSCLKFTLCSLLNLEESIWLPSRCWH